MTPNDLIITEHIILLAHFLKRVLHLTLIIWTVTLASSFHSLYTACQQPLIG